MPKTFPAEFRKDVARGDFEVAGEHRAEHVFEAPATSR
jgi:hypothetical protein